MKREIKKYLYDISVSIASINEYLGEKRDFNKFRESKLLKRAIEREIEIIGEAMNNILKIEPNIKIKNARKVVDTRNWVIQGYNKVDDVIIWGIVINYLPELQKDIEYLLSI